MSGSPLPKDTARTGAWFFALLLLGAAAVLLFYLDVQTKFSSRGSLVAQPRFWPAVGVIGMVIFGLAHLGVSWRERAPMTWVEGLTWLRALEFCAWFMAYVWAVPVIGYLMASILFAVLLALRQGYRGRMLGIAAVIGFAIVLIFKAGLSVKIPGGAIYEYLPGALRSFMILNF